MVFTDAVFDGVAVLDGLTARRVESPAELRRVLTVATGRTMTIASTMITAPCADGGRAEGLI
jgi:hypothetical protein